MSYAISPFDDSAVYDIEHPDTNEAYHVQVNMIVMPYSSKGTMMRQYELLFRFMVKYTIGNDPKEYIGNYYYDKNNIIYMEEQFEKLSKDGKVLFYQVPELGPAYRPVVVSKGDRLTEEKQKEKVRDVPMPVKYAMYLLVNGDKE
jgi:hypothetical protein